MDKENRLFYFFEKITQIPRGSGNLEGIRKYLCQFAKENALEYVTDKAGNVIIKKPASQGREQEDTLILQGHMDMVAAVAPGCQKDMKTEAPEIFVDGDLIGAKGTTLGGDDGIALAMVLALLEDKELSAPALEALFTADEETGMYGAAGLDASLLKGRHLINIDSEDEGIFIAGCAGGARADCSVPLKKAEASDLSFLEFTIEGLKGGHSGQMINLGRANANMLAGRLLNELDEVLEGRCYFVSAKGGSADNAIASLCVLKVSVPSGLKEKALDTAKTLEGIIRNEYEIPDPDIKISVKIDEECRELYKAGDAAHFLMSLPNGVISMSDGVPGLPGTSLNLGVLRFENGILSACFSVRSETDSRKEDLLKKLKCITELAGGKISVAGVYPGWKFEQVSPLRKHMTDVYKDMYKKEAKVEAIHAGLECGLLCSKIKGLDAVSIGPDMRNVHTPDERLSISSSERVYEFLKTVIGTAISE